MNRKVRFARLHSTDTHLSAFGNIGAALPGSFTGMTLTMTTEGLYIVHKGVEGFIPAANVKIVELEPVHGVDAQAREVKPKDTKLKS